MMIKYGNMISTQTLGNLTVNTTRLSTNTSHYTLIISWYLLSFYLAFVVTFVLSLRVLRWVSDLSTRLTKCEIVWSYRPRPYIFIRYPYFPASGLDSNKNDHVSYCIIIQYTAIVTSRVHKFSVRKKICRVCFIRFSSLRLSASKARTRYRYLRKRTTVVTYSRFINNITISDVFISIIRRISFTVEHDLRNTPFDLLRVTGISTMAAQTSMRRKQATCAVIECTLSTVKINLNDDGDDDRVRVTKKLWYTIQMCYVYSRVFKDDWKDYRKTVKKR